MPFYLPLETLPIDTTKGKKKKKKKKKKHQQTKQLSQIELQSRTHKAKEDADM